MNHFKIINLPTYNDPRGSLTVLEKALPFDVARIYWIYGADMQIRGGHRHRYTRQALIAINGKVSVYLNDGELTDNIILDDPGKCLLVEPKDWHTMTFDVGAVLLVIASHAYDRSEYLEAPYE
jgi:hypothetical protein